MDGATFNGSAYRLARQDAGIPLVDIVAHAHRCTYRHVQQIERGPRQPSVELANRLISTLNELSGRTYNLSDFLAAEADTGPGQAA